MKHIKLFAAVFLLTGILSCGETTQTDNTTHSNDTMVIKENITDTATNSVSTDTTKR